MKIRALTGFLDPGWPLQPDRIATIAQDLKGARSALEDVGYEVQTLRIATPPPSEMDSPVPPGERSMLAKQIEAECFVQEVDYASIGPALPGEQEAFAVIPEVLGAAETVFTSGLFAEPEGGLSMEAARACGQVIRETSTLREDGFANLRFAALANVGSGSPFFPAAYHRGGPPALAVAPEAADLAVAALKESPSLRKAGERLTERIEGEAKVISRLARGAVSGQETRFLGIDFSLAPFPEGPRSLGTALRAMGVPAVGLAGSAAAAAFLADCLDRAQLERTGFCGLFLPVLEDSALAHDAAEGQLTVADLLLYATLCGAGLDTIPLPGDTGEEALTAVLIDLGALALRHNKPLTARLMPIPGKSAGDEIDFDFPYFSSSRVMSLRAGPLSGPLAEYHRLEIGPSSA